MKFRLNLLPKVSLLLALVVGDSVVLAHKIRGMPIDRSMEEQVERRARTLMGSDGSGSGNRRPNPTGAPTENPWTTITYDDFEIGWGSFTQVANGQAKDEGDARRVPKSNGHVDFVPQGDYALLIRDDSGEESSVFQRSDHDVTGYSKIRVSFSFKARRVDMNHGFFLEYSSDGGSSWSEVKEYRRFDAASQYPDPQLYAFDNGIYYYDTKEWDGESLDLDEESLDLNTPQARIRFRCNGNGNNDKIYIDEVLFEGYS